MLNLGLVSSVIRAIETLIIHLDENHKTFTSKILRINHVPIKHYLLLNELTTFLVRKLKKPGPYDHKYYEKIPSSYNEHIVPIFYFT